ncbi:hypothetical protein NPIL_200861 [Nephila pilipes]|uniref:Uncharacterized protein n=1 Tax=Nephila pilipes TaxID=299642 RepID=A0A8X6NH15_NEPPI|nr:hypothetical protein NPIL_200861 [Nephila pilipes]
MADGFLMVRHRLGALDYRCHDLRGETLSSVWIPCFLTSHIFLKSCMECKEVWSVDGVKRSKNVNFTRSPPFMKMEEIVHVFLTIFVGL